MSTKDVNAGRKPFKYMQIKGMGMCRIFIEPYGSKSDYRAVNDDGKVKFLSVEQLRALEI